MKRSLLFVAILAIVLSTVGTSPRLMADTYIGWGRVLNSRGDPLPWWPVTIYAPRQGSGYDRIYIFTDYRGHWQYGFSLCNRTGIACALGTPDEEDATCCWQTIECEGSTYFCDLIIQCGGPKEPPCPRF